MKKDKKEYSDAVTQAVKDYENPLPVLKYLLLAYLCGMAILLGYTLVWLAMHNPYALLAIPLTGSAITVKFMRIKRFFTFRREK